MAETKADLIIKAKELGIVHVNTSNTMAELRELIAQAEPNKHDKEALPTDEHEAVVAKAGKRSAKALAEAEEKVAKEARKAESAELPDPIKKNPAPKTRTRLERRGKKYRELVKLIDNNQTYNLAQALELACKTSTVKFDASVELHIRLNVDPKHADQNIRDSIVLPEGTGKTLRVAVFADEADVKKALTAGADIAGSDEFLQQLDKEEINFDVLVATPPMMVKLSKYARLLGPKGLMPNPKSGTVTTDVAKAVKESKGGKVEYRVDESGIVHIGIGKVSFGAAKLNVNAKAVIESVQNNKPSSVKGVYVLSCFTTTTMGPSIKFEM
ncbi:50S ribosomal protein L1 [Candidatus Saccharibacteria bacterium]|nr:50S ribosomal protein L1 [Candidatus Saccharibacteria bacterium]MCB9821506.1 50S ribosomal protein L1 [Candidatus Nomurabacteria bacterium]